MHQLDKIHYKKLPLKLLIEMKFLVESCYCEK